MKLPLSLVLAVALAGLQFIAITAVVTSSYVTSERALLSHARTLLSDVAANTIEHSRGFLNPGKAAAELATRLAENGIIARDNPPVLEKLLFQQLRLTPQFSGIYYGDRLGNFVYVMRSEGPGPFRSKVIVNTPENREVRLVWRDDDYRLVSARSDPTDTYDPRSRPWFQSAQERVETIWTDPYVFYSSQKPGITVASPVVAQDGTLLGVVGVDIEIDSISDFLSGLRIGAHGIALILNRNGDIIAHPDKDLVITERGDGTFGFNTMQTIDDPVVRAAFGELGDGESISVVRETPAKFAHDGAGYLATAAPQISAILPADPKASTSRRPLPRSGKE